MANVLLSLLKDKSTIYRLGGDEYYILLEGITLKNEIESFLGEVISEIENNNYLEGTRNHITTSMGIVSFPEDGSDVNELLMKVDLTMYSAKKSGKNQYKFLMIKLYQPLMNRLVWRRSFGKPLKMEISR